MRYAYRVNIFCGMRTALQKARRRQTWGSKKPRTGRGLSAEQASVQTNSRSFRRIAHSCG